METQVNANQKQLAAFAMLDASIAPSLLLP